MIDTDSTYQRIERIRTSLHFAQLASKEIDEGEISDSRRQELIKVRDQAIRVMDRELTALGECPVCGQEYTS